MTSAGHRELSRRRREEILKLHAKRAAGQGRQLEKLARRTPFFTGADLENILNEAAILTAKARDARKLPCAMDEAVMRVAVCPVRFPPDHRKGSPDDGVVTRRDTRWFLYFLPDGDSVHDFHSAARHAPGLYGVFAEETNYTSSAIARIASTLAGYCAEKLVFGDVNTGLNSDLKSATNTARRMVTEFGMSDVVGPVFLGGDHEVFFGPRFLAGARELFLKKLPRGSIAKFVDCWKRAWRSAMRFSRITCANWKRWWKFPLEREKVDNDEFTAVMEGRSAEAYAGGRRGNRRIGR